jgi:4-hydroxy-tetrahydrodipicolinate reductase
MKIAIIGYGKMGKAIEKIALDQGHEIALKINSENLNELSIQNLQQADVAIEFSNPESAYNNIKLCLQAQIPVVSGSTGWTNNKQLTEIETFCIEQKGAFLYASNFSIGVNIFFAINEKLATLMAPRSEYNVSIQEIHHTHKKDAPSGTAITIAEGIIRNNPSKTNWHLGSAHSNKNEIAITSIRQDPAPGTHIVTYHSTVDSIEITHTAHNRDGFANGALLAASFLVGKSGLFKMKDVLEKI